MPQTNERRRELYALNRDKLLQQKRSYREANKEKVKAQAKALAPKYWSSPKGKFRQQKGTAKIRGIGWELTFDEWWDLWQRSGKWEQRGSGQYMMCRTNDEGPYAIGNVRIDDATGNIRERYSINRN